VYDDLLISHNYFDRTLLRKVQLDFLNVWNLIMKTRIDVKRYAIETDILDSGNRNKAKYYSNIGRFKCEMLYFIRCGIKCAIQ
jgi:hypothetical protein